MKYLLTEEKTERLDFKLLTQAHFDEWMPLFTKPEVPVYLGMDTQLSQIELCEAWFKKSLGRYENETGGMNVLVDRELGKMVGQCGLLIQNINEEEFMEIGYSILPEYWGKGYASEAAIKCKHFAFEQGFTDEIISMVHVDNIGSEKVAKRNGMTFFRNYPDYKGQPVNVFRITKEQYLKQAN